MNHSKIILVGIISAFVALTTSVLGVAGTVIGSVISSVLYNMLSEALEEPVSHAASKRHFEWDLAYIFPLVVIAIIQFVLILAFLAQWGILPSAFLNIYLLLQNVANNNLYRVLGISLLVMSVYPFILKPEFVNKWHGLIIALVGLIFLARGFVDLGNRITDVYDDVFIYFDFPIALLAFFLLVFVILRVIYYANTSDRDFDSDSKNQFKNTRVKRVSNSKGKDGQRNQIKKTKKGNRVRQNRKKNNSRVVRDDSEGSSIRQNPGGDKYSEMRGSEKSVRINRSSDNIQFESNDLLDDYKK
ncbi:MAG: hypothetical protein IKE95_02405 [Methanobrevibacter sp.]|nr:hypothetical protein [Methanobrevibacter sp.]